MALCENITAGVYITSGTREKGHYEKIRNSAVELIIGEKESYQHKQA